MSETPSAVEQGGAARPGREAEWGRRFAALTLAWLAAETLTGLAVWLLPFSVPAQWLVVTLSPLWMQIPKRLKRLLQRYELPQRRA